MAKVAERLNQALGLARLAKSAKTAEEHDALLVRVVADHHRAVEAVALLEGERGTVLLDGGDLDSFHQKLAAAEQNAVSLSLAVAEAERRRDAARAAESASAIEEAARTMRDYDLPALAQAIRDIHTATAAVLAATARKDEAEAAIQWTSELAKNAGRSDLVAHPGEIMQQIGAELDEEPQEPPPERHATESEEAHALRLMNWSAKITARENPVATQAKLAREALERVANGERDAFERGVKGLEVDVEKFVRSGEVMKKVRITGGNGRVRTLGSEIR